MKLEQRIREAEKRLVAANGLDAEETFVELGSTGVRLRTLQLGQGPPVVFLHGVSLAAAAWAPWLPLLPGFRAVLVELPGHGLSGPARYRAGSVREHTLLLLDELLAALGLPAPAIVGHSLGGMFALWYAAARPGRIASLVVIGEPAVALPGVEVRMPLSLLTVPLLGELVQRGPTPRATYRRLLAQGLGRGAAASMPDDLVDLLRLSTKRKENARTVASLMHAINDFRQPRPGSVMSDGELARVSTPTVFCLGSDDPFLPPARAAPSVAKIPGAVLREVRGGHAPWFDDPVACAGIVATHLETGGRHARA